MRIDLPSGAYAELMAPDSLRSKHVRIMTRAISKASMDRRDGDVIIDTTDGSIAVIVQEWSCVGADGKPLPLPSADMAVLDDMDPFDYYALLNHDFVTQVTAKFTKLQSERVDPSDHADPASPTEPSAESGHGLREIESRPAKTSSPRGTKSKATSGSPSAGAGPRSK